MVVAAGAPSLAQATQTSGAALHLPAELRSYLQKFVGDAPADCGRYFLPRPFAPANTNQLQQTVGCAIESGQAHKPFVGFSQSQGIDSEVFDGLLGTTAGFIFRFSFDSAPCGGPGCAGRFSIQGCAIPSVMTAPSGYTSLGCRPIGEVNDRMEHP